MIRTEKISEMMCEKHGLMYDIASRLPTLLEDAGFENIKCEWKQEPLGGRRAGELGVLGARIFKQLFKSFWPTLLRYDIIESEAEYEQLLNAREEEWETFEAYYECRVIVARKPGDQ